MNILNSFKQGFSDAQSTVSCIQSLIEYTENFKSKLASFLDDSDANKTITIALSNQGEQKIVKLSKTLYDQALNDLSGSINIPINDAGDTINVDSAQVVDTIEDIVQENTLQNEFLKYCTDGVESKTSDFLSTISSKYVSFSGAVVEKYSQLISSSPLQSLSNFCNLFKNGKLEVKTDGTVEYLTLASQTEFENCPNIWLLAVTEITVDIINLFDDIISQFAKIGDVFKAIGDGIVKIATWIVKKVSGNLLTVYSQGDKKFGIMDFPIFQIPICKYDLSDPTMKLRQGIAEQLDNLLERLGAKDQQSGAFAFWHGSSNGCSTITVPYQSGEYSFDMDHGTRSSIRVRIQAAISVLLEQMENRELATPILMPLDVIIPCSKFQPYTDDPWGACDIICRFGPAHDDIGNFDYMALQMFVADSFDNWNSFNDYQNYMRVWATVGRLGNKIASLIPINFGNLFDKNEKTGSYNWSRLDELPDWRALLLDRYSTEWGENNIAVAGHVHCLTSTFDDFTDFIAHILMNKDLSAWGDVMSCFNWVQFILGLISYCALSVPIETDKKVYLLIGELRQITYRNIVDRILMPQSNYNISANFTDFTWNGSILYESRGFDDEFYFQIFKPYLKYSVTPVAIHLQNISEQVKEAQTLIYSALVAVAAVIITVKLVKFRKKRLIKQSLAQAQADSLSWDVFNPEKNVSVKDYVKARNKAKRISRLNGMLGFSSQSQLAENTAAAIDGLTGSVFAASGQNMDNQSSDQPKYNFGTLYKVITGKSE